MLDYPCLRFRERSERNIFLSLLRSLFILGNEYPMFEVARKTLGYASKLAALLTLIPPSVSFLQAQESQRMVPLTLQGSPTAEQAEAFAKTRAKVLSLPRTLPNVICKQSTDRFVASNDEPVQHEPETAGSPSHALYGIPASTSSTRKQTNSVEYGNQAYAVSEIRPPRDLKWKYTDTISAEVAYVDGSESYSGITLNGRPTGGKKMDNFLGLTSVGEFGSDLIDLLSVKQAQATEFRFRGTETLFDRPVLIFDFRVQKDNNFHWHWWVRTVRLFHKGPKIESWPSYAGALWIDAVRQEVLRLEIRAVEIDPKFPLKTMEQTTDYGHVQAGDLSDLLVPLRSETITCDRSDPMCHRNVLELKEWRKFVVKSRVLAPTQ